MALECQTCGITDDDQGLHSFSCTACGDTHAQCKWCRENDVLLYTCPTTQSSQLLPWPENRYARLSSVDWIAYRLSRWKLQRQIAECERTADIVDLAYDFDGYGLYRSIHPWQRREELMGLVNAFDAHAPETIVEIGTGKGGTLFTMSLAIDSVERIVSIDLPGGQYGGGYTDNQISFFESFTDDVEYTFVRRDSHNKGTYEQVERALPNGTTDALYIDADHSYKGVKRDFQLYEQLVVDEGLIGLHDIVHRLNENPRSDYGVDRFWTELQNTYATEEIISDPRSKAYGNGLVYLSGQDPVD